MGNWRQRWQRRQQELDRGVDADLVLENPDGIDWGLAA